MADRVLRGSRLGAVSYETDRNHDLAPRRTVRYACPKNHEFEVPFSDDAEAQNVLLTRQFRYPVYVNDHPDGMLLETAAGLLDDDDAETAIRREAEEETGVRIGELEHVFDVYMSPGSVTERVHCYAAPYTPAQRGTGGGIAEEGEDIEVVELPLTEALAMIETGEIADAKTIMLLQWAALRRLVP